MTRRLAIVAEARAWIGTPYQHQASVRGQGADCLGLVRGVWRSCVGEEPCAVGAYSPDWAESDTQEPLLTALRLHFAPLSLAAAQPGDVAAFRMAPGARVKHVAVIVAHDRLVHAYWGRAVVESRFGAWWRARWACAFAFPEG